MIHVTCTTKHQTYAVRSKGNISVQQDSCLGCAVPPEPNQCSNAEEGEAQEINMSVTATWSGVMITNSTPGRAIKLQQQQGRRDRL